MTTEYTATNIILQGADGGYLIPYTEKQDPLTDDQLAAVNSGITSTKVSTYDGYATELAKKADATTTLAGYGITDAYTKTEVDEKVSSVYRYKGSVATIDNLPTTGNVVGDVYNVEDTGMNYAWQGTAWDALGTTIDLSKYAKTEDLATVATTGSYNDLVDKLVIDATLSETSTNAIQNKAVYSELSNKQATLVSGSNIKTINNQSILGEGNISVTGGSGDYDDLTNRPQINSITLTGNKTLADLGIQTKGDYVVVDSLGTLAYKSSVSEDDISGTISQDKITNLSVTLGGKQDSLTEGTNISISDANVISVSKTIPDTTDTVTEGAAAALTSGGAYTALSGKQNTLTTLGSATQPVYVSANGTLSTCNTIPTTTSSIVQGSTAALTSGGAYTGLAAKVNTADVQSTYSATGTNPVNGTAVAAALATLAGQGVNVSYDSTNQALVFTNVGS